MMTATNILHSPVDVTEDDLFEMANLYPRTTGLPMTVWASNRGKAQHDVRVKVCRVHGDRMDADNTASVAIRPVPKVMAGTLSPSDFHAVERWIQVNSEALIGYWDGTIDTAEFIPALVKVS